jgi:hypothetical protein
MIERYFLRCDECGLETYNDGSPFDEKGNKFHCLCRWGLFEPVKRRIIISGDEPL